MTNDPLLSDEELEAELKKRLKGRGLTDDQRLNLMLDHEATMVARASARAAAQAHYDAGKGRVPDKGWTDADNVHFRRETDGN